MICLQDKLSLIKKKERERARQLKMEVLKLTDLIFSALIRNPMTGQARDATSVFEELDEDGNGSLDRMEFVKGLQSCGVELEEEQVDLVWEHLDEDKGGSLDYSEVCEKLREKSEEAKRKKERLLSQMPFKISSKVEQLHGEGLRARVDVKRDFRDSAEAQLTRWLTRLKELVLADLRDSIPLVGLANLEEIERATEGADASSLFDTPEFDGQRLGTSQPSNVSEFQEEFDETLSAAQENSNWPVALVGEPGPARTQLFQTVVEHLEYQSRSDGVIYHRVGGSPFSHDISLLLTRVCLELRSKFHLRGSIPQLDYEPLKQEFASLLLQAKITSRLYLVLEDLDLLERDGRRLEEVDWLPQSLPFNFKLVVSCSDGRLLNNLKQSRTSFGHSSELYEIWLDSASLDGPPSPSSPPSSASSHRSHADPQSSALPATGHTFHAAWNELGICQRLELGAELGKEQVLEALYQHHGKASVQRLVLLLLVGREGLLEQDLYELLNLFSEELQLPPSRCSWPRYQLLLNDLKPAVSVLPFGQTSLVMASSPQRMGWLAAACEQLDKTEGHKLVALHYLTNLRFLEDEIWHGEHRFKVTD